MAIVWRCLRDSIFSRFDRTPECDKQTHTHTRRHTTPAYTVLPRGATAIVRRKCKLARKMTVTIDHISYTDRALTWPNTGVNSRDKISCVFFNPRCNLAQSRAYATSVSVCLSVCL